MKSFARYVILAPLAAALAGPAVAQTIPLGQSCGGLLCDVGMFGHKVPVNGDGSAPTQQQLATAETQAEANDPHRLPCNDFLCRAFGGKPAAAPPPPVVAAEPAPEPVKTKKAHRKKHVARAETKTAETRTAEPAPAAQ